MDWQRGKSAFQFDLNSGFHTITIEEKFSCEIKLILPVQICLQKYSVSVFTQITSRTAAVSSHSRGVSRSSRTRGGMWWTQAALLTRARALRTVKACGPDAPPPASSLRVAIRKRRPHERPISGQSTIYTVNTLAC